MRSQASFPSSSSSSSSIIVQERNLAPYFLYIFFLQRPVYKRRSSLLSLHAYIQSSIRTCCKATLYTNRKVVLILPRRKDVVQGALHRAPMRRIIDSPTRSSISLLYFGSDITGQLFCNGKLARVHRRADGQKNRSIVLSVPMIS